jgi:hypothetical protein
LLGDEPIKRLVGIERVDDVVAMSPSVGERRVPTLADAVGIPHDVEPMPPPAFPKSRRLQQPIDHLCQRCVIADLVRAKRFDFFGTRWQADQVKRDAPQECRSFRVAGSSEFRLLKFRLNKPVDVRLRPGGIANFRSLPPAMAETTSELPRLLVRSPTWRDLHPSLPSRPHKQHKVPASSHASTISKDSQTRIIEPI